MISLSAEIRDNRKDSVEKIRKAGKIPAVVYGHKVKNILLKVDHKEFLNVYKKTGESSLIELKIEGEKDLPAQAGKRLVLIHEIQLDPVTDKAIHIDFLQPSLKEEVQVKVPLVFEGASLAVKDLGGTLVKNISEIEIKALPQDLPHEIKISIDGLKTFEDRILVKDLVLPKGVKILLSPDEIVVSVSAPTKVEEELAKPVEEKVEEVEKVEKEKKVEEVMVEENPKSQ